MALTSVQSEMLGTGGALQTVYTAYLLAGTTTTIIPNDDTIPQITEGAEFITATITPKSATNKLLITAAINVSPSASSNIIAALFQDSTANALAAAFELGSSASEVRRIVFQHYMTAGTTSATTFRLRAGMGNAGTLTINGSGGTRLLGGVAVSSLCVQEIAG